MADRDLQRALRQSIEDEQRRIDREARAAAAIARRREIQSRGTNSPRRRRRNRDRDAGAARAAAAPTAGAGAGDPDINLDSELARAIQMSLEVEPSTRSISSDIHDPRAEFAMHSLSLRALPGQASDKIGPTDTSLVGSYKLDSPRPYILLDCYTEHDTVNGAIINPAITLKTFRAINAIQIIENPGFMGQGSYRVVSLLLGNGGHFIAATTDKENPDLLHFTDDLDIGRDKTVDTYETENYRVAFVLVVAKDLYDPQPLPALVPNIDARCLANSCIAFFSNLPEIFFDAFFQTDFTYDTFPLLATVYDFRAIRGFTARGIENLQRKLTSMEGIQYGQLPAVEFCVQRFLQELIQLGEPFLSEGTVQIQNESGSFEPNFLSLVANALFMEISTSAYSEYI